MQETPELIKDLKNISEEGNTKSSSVRTRNWFFTIPYEKELNVSKLIQLFKFSGVKKFLFQLESGEKTGYIHYQGVIGFENQRTFSCVKQMHPTAHWERCKSIKWALEYCSKIDTKIAGPWSEGFGFSYNLGLYDLKLKPWQEEICQTIFNRAPDDRTINWVYDAKGGSGKTTLAKYICSQMENVICVQGKCTDIKHAINCLVQKGNTPRAVIFIFPRSVEEYVSYDAIECVKDGLFFSGKYDSGMCIFPNPHVYIFANFPPQMDKLTSDRWKIHTL